MFLLFVFAITLLSGLVAVTGGNGLILMPCLILMDFNIKDILAVVRVSAVVFVAFNLLALIRNRNPIEFNKNDLLITIASCASVICSVHFLNKIGNTPLMFTITLILILLFLLIVFKPTNKRFTWAFIFVLPIFAGICGSAVGGAGLIIGSLYVLIGFDPVRAVQKRIIPSLIIQIVSLVSFLSYYDVVNRGLLYTVIVATAIAGYLNMKIFMKLSPRNGKILFYASFIFSLTNLIEDSIESLLEDRHLSWMWLFHKIF